MINLIIVLASHSSMFSNTLNDTHHKKSAKPDQKSKCLHENSLLLQHLFCWTSQDPAHVNRFLFAVLKVQRTKHTTADLSTGEFGIMADPRATIIWF